MAAEKMLIEPGTYLIDTPPKKRIAKKFRTVAVTEDGRLFVHPCLAGGNGQSALMCAMFDGSSIVSAGNAALVWSDWLIENYPKTKELVDNILSSLVEANPVMRQNRS